MTDFLNITYHIELIVGTGLCIYIKNRIRKENKPRIFSLFMGKTYYMKTKKTQIETPTKNQIFLCYETQQCTTCKLENKIKKSFIIDWLIVLNFHNYNTFSISRHANLWSFFEYFLSIYLMVGLELLIWIFKFIELDKRALMCLSQRKDFISEPS